MTNLEMVRLQFNHRQKNVEEMEKELARFHEDLGKGLARGNINMVAQYGRKITEIAFKLDAVKKEMVFFEDLLNQLETEAE